MKKIILGLMFVSFFSLNSMVHAEIIGYSVSPTKNGWPISNSGGMGCGSATFEDFPNGKRPSQYVGRKLYVCEPQPEYRPVSPSVPSEPVVIPQKTYTNTTIKNTESSPLITTKNASITPSSDDKISLLQTQIDTRDDAVAKRMDDIQTQISHLQKAVILIVLFLLLDLLLIIIIWTLRKR